MSPLHFIDTDHSSGANRLLMPGAVKVILVIDLVESVRLMQQDEQGTVLRWHAFTQEARRLIESGGGRVVKSLGDGLMAEFDQAQHAASVAAQLHAQMRPTPGVEPMALRMGLNAGAVYQDQADIYGNDVNLAARLCGLAGPGETVASQSVRDLLTHGLDANLSDLGECYLKHLDQPVRAYRLGPVGNNPLLRDLAEEQESLRPTIAVVPFRSRSTVAEEWVIGELIADGVIASLSRLPDVRVISRMSTHGLRERSNTPEIANGQLGAKYLLSGSYAVMGENTLIMAELVDTQRNEVIWAERLSQLTLDLLQTDSQLIGRLAQGVNRQIVNTEVARTLSQPLPRLDSNALMLGGIGLMHRTSMADFQRSREILSVLIERHGRVANLRAWLAKWHVLNIVRGLSADPQREVQIALSQTQRALDLDPENALTLSVEGHIYTQLLGEFGLAEQRLNAAVKANPNESMAWLFKSVLSTMWGSASESVSEAFYAEALSPLDPIKYYYDLITASALLANQEHEGAVRYARHSIQANAHHAPAYRVLLTAQVELGQIEEGRRTLARLLQEQPGLTIQKYMAIGSSQSVTRQRCIAALRALGVPDA
ncbi:tetratricopeptide repeat protein [Curvibacter sp. RS43]|uniref:adenylate/guanylate cyclase domain-containing protein n=1 Tax=Curvibacter microcysteis TaxID=3026419 RepID=UPI002361F522|nr:adenylate/guanylate cyclase domain-containing protein [Curvibacter sp. RS43]MDD0810104.1 tetratricopeptide repeat protein [Curvibacter sp. RS43]